MFKNASKAITIMMSLSLLFCSSFASAMTYEQCFRKASKKFNVSYNHLISMAFTESSYNPRATNSRLNKNGSADYGFMQINTLWKREAQRKGLDWNHIKYDGCANVAFGAWILSQNYRRLKSWRSAIGAYNAGFSKSTRARNTRSRYYSKVSGNLNNAKRYVHRLKKSIRPSRSYNRMMGLAYNKPQKKPSVKPVALVNTPKPLHSHNVKIVGDHKSAGIISSKEGLIFMPVLLQPGENPPIYLIAD